MKKLLSIIISIMFSLGLNAQTGLTQAPDFTTTDYFGNEINLYEILEGGQHVLLHITHSQSDSLSKNILPLVEAYKKLGCNQHDIFFIAALTNGTHEKTAKYVEKYDRYHNRATQRKALYQLLRFLQKNKRQNCKSQGN